MDVINIRCNVCKDNFNKNTRLPLILPCGHTYCSECLQNLIEKDQNNAKCYSCLEQFGNHCFEQLSVNYSLLDISNEFKTQKQKRESQMLINDTSGRSKYLIYTLKKRNDELNETYIKCDNHIFNLQDQIKEIENEKSSIVHKQNEIQELIENLGSLNDSLTDENLQSIDETLKLAERHVVFGSKLQFLVPNKEKNQEDTSTTNEKYAILVEGGRNRYSKTTSLGKVGYHLHVLTSTKPIVGAKIIKYPDLKSSFQQLMVFMDLNWNNQPQGRIVFQLYKDISRSQIFHHMCSGRRGISYREIESLEAKSNGSRGMEVRGGVCTAASVETFQDLLEDDEGLEIRPSISGLLTVSVDDDLSKKMNFYVSLRGKDGEEIPNVIGEIVCGLEILRAAARYEPSHERSVIVSDCGIIVHY